MLKREIVMSTENADTMTDVVMRRGVVDALHDRTLVAAVHAVNLVVVTEGVKNLALVLSRLVFCILGNFLKPSKLHQPRSDTLSEFALLCGYRGHADRSLVRGRGASSCWLHDRRATAIYKFSDAVNQ